MIGMAPPRNDGCACAGFTLLEVLAALAVLGLILVALSAGLRFGEQALVSQARDTMVENQVGPVDDALRSLVSRAWPGSVGAEARFAGTAQVLSFRTMMPESLTAQRTRDADVTIAVDPEHRLYLTWLPWYRNWIVPKPPPARIDLLSNVDHIEFAYWDPSLHLPPGGWVTAWVGTTVPKLLRIRLVFKKGAGLRWPDIIVATARDQWTY
jgi:general secretion pathway protein J